MLKQGWLNRQIQNASEDVKSWPLWMRREAKLEEGKQNAKDTHNTKGMKASKK
jgi:hypothetical protein